MTPTSPPSETLQLDPLESVIDTFARGGMVIIVDDADRENEGDLVVATECITPEALAFMMNEGRGLICVSISVETAQRLTLPLQVVNNNSPFQTPFAISIDHRETVPFGVTAAARARTMKALVSAATTASDFVSPGHVFPLIANEAGVMGRQGQTEGSFDLAKLAGLQPSGVICEILHPDGTMLRGEALQVFAAKHNLPITSVAEIRRYRSLHEIAVRRASFRKTATDFGDFHAQIFIDDVGRKEHLALMKGEVASMPASYAPLVRIHSECLTGDVFSSQRCDCGPQLAGAMELIEKEGAGVLLYLRQEGRGIGLVNKLKAYGLQDQGLDTVEANVHLGFQPDERDFAVAAHMLHDLGITQVRLITNNPRKESTLVTLGIRVVERIPIVVPFDAHNSDYLRAKREKLGHLL